MVSSKYALHIVFVSALCASSGFAQLPVKPRASPLAIASAKYKDTYIKITYSQPHRRGREVFGKLVPYNEVWRTGANEATEITLTREAYIGSLLVPAGTYTLFTIPGEEKWTIILNKENGLWGSYNYNAKLDLLRFEVSVSANSVSYEAFTIVFDQRNNVAELLLLWDTVKVSIPIQFIEPKI